MKNRGEEITNCKRRGEWAEMYFMTCAAEHGLHVSRPYGEMTHFDFVVGDHGCLLRVQVKSTLSRKDDGYGCTVRGAQSLRYGPDAFDFLAAVIVPERVWYIIPAELIQGKGKIFLNPSSSKLKYSPYKEAWHLLRPRDCALRGTISHIEASAADVLPNVLPASLREIFA